MPIKVEVSYSSPPENWDNMVCDLGGNIFHSHVWAVLQSGLRRITPLYICAKNQSGQDVGGALAFLIQSEYPVLSKILRVLEITSHPFGRGLSVEDIHAFMKGIEIIAKRLQCANIILNSNMSGQSSFIPEESGFSESRRIEFHVDLTKSVDELWSCMAKDQRAKVRQLEKKGIVIDEGPNRADFDYLHKVRIMTQKKRSQSGLGYALNEDENYYDTLYNCLTANGKGRLFLAKFKSEVVAAIYFSTFNGQAYSVLSGSSQTGYKLGAQSGLFWQALNIFKNEGFLLLNRGGVEASTEDESNPLHGLYRFKKRLGTVPVLCRSGEKITSPIRHKILNLKNKIFK